MPCPLAPSRLTKGKSHVLIMNLNSLLDLVQNVRRRPPHNRLKVGRIVVRDYFGRKRRERVIPLLKKATGQLFHFVYYDSSYTWPQNHWFGTPIQQFPSDLFIYQEIISSKTPDYIIQTGVYDGGSALFLAHMLDLAKAPESALVVAVDIELRPSTRALTHPRIRLLEGDSTAPSVLAQIEALVSNIPFVNGGMASLDSDHSQRHVAKELGLYPRFVGVGNYLVVEDTTVNGRPVMPEHGPGPGEALDKWLPHHSEFERDDALWQRQLFSAHAGGWLRRVR